MPTTTTTTVSFHQPATVNIDRWLPRLAARAARQTAHGIVLPDGSWAPPCHQHADDTSIHTATVAAAAVAVTEVVLPFCSATNGLLSVPTCIGMMLGPQAASPPVGSEPLTGMQFVHQPGKSVRHL